ncbi:hypothetical protein [Pelagibaculum spongiae]|uniref:Uncharacterized protein n=1 Tax=Pelagibaculum spongiae TaxID=2080658 RepID=A0A2V1H6H5_9GAMM|nr:hypothetical protein [Pelagibaculum spongiae]PVZ72365.1 hypothetical protein DC094_04995 [Pelagibaculum spongiae]
MLKTTLNWIPLSLFVLLICLNQPSDRFQWDMIFLLSGLVALLTLPFTTLAGIPQDRISLGINLFFSSSTVAFLIGFPEITHWYQEQRVTALMLWVVGSCIVTGLITKQGCFDVDVNHRKLKSCLLVGAAVASLTASWWFRPSVFLSEVMPLISLLICRQLLVFFDSWA